MKKRRGGGGGAYLLRASSGSLLLASYQRGGWWSFLCLIHFFFSVHLNFHNRPMIILASNTRGVHKYEHNDFSSFFLPLLLLLIL